MKRSGLSFIFMVCFIFNALGQTTYKTYFGDYVSPVDTFRVLNIFINIIYDLCDTCDLAPSQTPLWLPGTVNTINSNPPSYLAGFMDTELSSNLQGSYTKRYAQASSINL